MPVSLRTIDLRAAAPDVRAELLRRQWLVTNGLGGYASGTLGGDLSWRYHGMLVAALPPPLGRTVMLNQLEEWLRLPDGRAQPLGGTATDAEAAGGLADFSLEDHIPRWRFVFGEVLVEKWLLMPNLQNTVHVTFAVRGAPPGTTIELRPHVSFRRFETDVDVPLARGYEIRCRGRDFEIHGESEFPPLRLTVRAAQSRFVHEGGTSRQFHYPRDKERGCSADGVLWSPGFFSIPAEAGTITLIASTEDWRTIRALKPEEALETEQARLSGLVRKARIADDDPFAAGLVLAADQVLIAPSGRIYDAASARAAGDELRSVIAGYHWFTDWGRDTMISLEGLALATGRWQEARWILRAFARYVRDGLIPNLFPEGEHQGLYHTADASLWFFQAVHRYVALTDDTEILVSLLPVLRSMIDHHLQGTHFGIGVDPVDGLLRQGAAGFQLTWMDAKVGDWVVTPRRGKAVEINALWYNALRLAEHWVRAAGDAAGADGLRDHANRAEQAFNRRFWNPERRCLFDVVDGETGDDPSLRPNQVFALALTHPVLAPERWPAVLAAVESHLLTPFGLRTLSPGEPDYKPRYSGDLRARDAAYHQGTVWPWLIGAFIDAWMRVHPEQRADARRFLQAFPAHFEEACVGSISEIFDAEPPFHPRGAVAQAWSVAEVLRTWLQTAPGAHARAGGSPTPTAGARPG